MDVSVQTWDFWYNFFIGFAVKFYAIGWKTSRVAEAMRALVQGLGLLLQIRHRLRSQVLFHWVQYIHRVRRYDLHNDGGGK